MSLSVQNPFGPPTPFTASADPVSGSFNFPFHGSSQPTQQQQFAPVLDSLHRIGRPTIAPYAPIAPQFKEMAPVAIARPPSSYYENLFNAKFEPLKQDYFGRGGISDQSVGEANRRGFMTAGPSGVAGQLYEKTVTDPFARTTANIQNQVNIIRTETEMDLAKYDATRQDEFRKFQADLQTRDRDYGMASVESQARIDSAYLGLEAEVNEMIAKGASAERIADLNARVNTYQVLVNAENEKARLRQSDIESQRKWWTENAAIPGGLAPSTPFEELGLPRPVAPIEERSASPSQDQAPEGDGDAYGEDVNAGRQPVTGRDGRQWRWNLSRGIWLRT